MPNSVPYNVVHWRTGRMTSQKRRALTRAAIEDTSKLLVIAINVDAVSHKLGKDLLTYVMRKRPTLMIVDESSDIADHSSNRSRAVNRLGRLAFSRRILNGSPGDALRLFAQFSFLDWRFLGQPKWREFQLAWAEWNVVKTGTLDSRGVEKFFLVQKREPLTNKPVFKNQEEFNKRMYAHAFRCTKDECFDLPPKMYNKIFPTLNAEQHSLYKQLVEEYEAMFPDGATVSVSIKLTLYLRLQQIICGYVPVDHFLELDELRIPDPVRIIEGPNDRLRCLMDFVDHSGDTQGIIWTRFRMDRDLITNALKERGSSFVEIYGGNPSTEARTLARNQFQAGEAQWMVANQAAGGRGYTLTAARLMAYYSQYFGLERRLQSEDRAHRYGTVSLTITDFVVPGSIDEVILRALRNGKEVADELTGDIPKPWI